MVDLGFSVLRVLRIVGTQALMNATETGIEIEIEIEIYDATARPSDKYMTESPGRCNLTFAWLAERATP